MNTPTAWSLLNDEASTWSPSTYENAKILVCSMRCAAVSESDVDLIRTISKIQLYHQIQFAAASSLDVLALCD